MKKFTGIVLFVAIIAVVQITNAQSRRIPPNSGTGKTNQRATTPTPTPTPSSTAGQTPEPTTDIPDGIEEVSGVESIETRLVTLPIRVIDRKGRFVGGVGKESRRQRLELENLSCRFPDVVGAR